LSMTGFAFRLHEIVHDGQVLLVRSCPMVFAV
jgi:hypothetical protein